MLFLLVAISALSEFRLRCSGLSIGSVFLRLRPLSLFLLYGVPDALVLLVFCCVFFFAAVAVYVIGFGCRVLCYFVDLFPGCC